MATIKMTELTKALQDRGLKAVFAMSGGNCGTIYIGEADAEGNYEFGVGPSNYYRDEAQMEELCWGIDGGSDADVFQGSEEEFTVENIAEIILLAYWDAVAHGFWGSACGACGEWNHGKHSCSEDMFACGSCGDSFEMKDGAVVVNQGFTEFTCHGCKVVA